MAISFVVDLRTINFIHWSREWVFSLCFQTTFAHIVWFWAVLGLKIDSIIEFYSKHQLLFTRIDDNGSNGAFERLIHMNGTFGRYLSYECVKNGNAENVNLKKIPFHVLILIFFCLTYFKRCYDLKRINQLEIQNNLKKMPLNFVQTLQFI